MSEWEYLDPLEIQQDLISPIEQVEYLASKSDFNQLGQKLPELLEIGQTLALYSGVTLSRPGQILRPESIVEEPARLLHRLAQALLPLLARRKGAALAQLIQWAYQICLVLGLWEAATIYAIELAWLSLREKKVHEAKRWSEEAATTNQNAKSESLKADILFVKGKIALNREEYSLAYSYYNTAVRLLKKQPKAEKLVECVLAIGEIHIYYNEFDKAIVRTNEAIVIAHKSGLEKYLLKGYYYSGLAYFYKEDYHTATSNLTEALLRAQQQNDQLLQADILQKLAEARSYLS